MAQISRPYQIVARGRRVLAGVCLFAPPGRPAQHQRLHLRPAGRPATLLDAAPPVRPRRTLLSRQASTARPRRRQACTKPSSRPTAPVPDLRRTNAQISRDPPKLERTPQAASSERGRTALAAAPRRAATTSARARRPHRPARAPPPHTTRVHARRRARRTRAPRTSARARRATSAPAGQRAVEAELTQGQGRPAAVLEPRGTDDGLVHDALSARPAVPEADRSRQANCDRGARNTRPARSRPTAPSRARCRSTARPRSSDQQHGQTSADRVQDAFSIEQAIDEARSR